MLSFKSLSEKKTKVTINPKLKDVMEGDCGTPSKMSKGGAITVDKIKNNCGDDCDCKKCEKKRRAEELGDETTVSTEETAYVSQEEVSEESDQSIDQKETSTLLTFGQFNEDRAADAQKSLAKVKDRQKVLDAHEKKTGKKLDINKSVEARDHKKNFPGAKRQAKKVKGAKETPAQTQDRRIRQSSTRIATKGYTSKEKKEVDSMAKHASRFD